MNIPKLLLFSVLGLVNIAFVLAWTRAARRNPARESVTAVDILIGCVTDFFDTLGIGSFAPTTAIFKLRGKPADELIPGTLNIGHNASAVLDTIIFVTVVAVDPLLLVLMVGSAAIGAWLGAGVGLYAPCMIMLALLGLNPLAAFPIMMAPADWCSRLRVCASSNPAASRGDRRPVWYSGASSACWSRPSSSNSCP